MLIGWFIPSIGTKVKSGQVHTQLTNMDENRSFRSSTEEQDDDVRRKENRKKRRKGISKVKR